MHTKLVLVIPALAGILLTAVLACNNADPEAVLARTQSNWTSTVLCGSKPAYPTTRTSTA